MAAKPAVFLDRDGTINEEINYLSAVEDFHFIKGAIDAIRRLNRAGVPVVIVTNQAGVARGYYDERQVERIHAYLRESLAVAGAHYDGIYFCPHHPKAGIGEYKIDCHCRKPRPGMLEQAADELHLTLDKSFIVGDKMSDLQAGVAVGCRTVLVRTGYGAEVEKTLSSQPHQPDFVADDLIEAVDWILANLPAAGSQGER